MSTTTLQAFWFDGFASTATDFIFGNWPAFSLILIIFLGIMLFGGLIMVMKRAGKW